MSAQDSNLSATGYNYDLVTALSQDALNASMKQLLVTAGTNTAPLTVYYKFNDSSHTTGTSVMTADEVSQMLGTANPFDVPTNTSSSSTNSSYVQLGNAMANAGFAYAFSVLMGCPTGMKKMQMPDVITLNIDSATSSQQDLSQTVQYNMYFASFALLQLTYGYNTWTFEQADQPSGAPWEFQWLVDLNLSLPENVSFDDLPPTAQNNLKLVDNLNTSSMFSLQQLFLDLNTPQLVSGANPSVIGFPPTDPIYTDLNAFIANYWTILQQNGGVHFTSSVSPQSTYPPSSIVPTALNFVVSPYSDQSQPGLSTLCYLVMTNSDTMPSPIGPFNWNWVDDDTIAGIMSVRRALIAGYLNNALSPSLTPICQNVTVDLHSKNDEQVTITPSDTARTYTIEGSNPCLTFSYNSYQKDTGYIPSSIPFDPIPTHVSLQVSLTVSSTVQFVANTIKASTIVSVYFEYDLDGVVSQTKGYPLAQQNNTTFTLSSVGAGTTSGNSTAGLLQITCVTDPAINLTQTSNKDGAYYNGDLDPSWVAKIGSFWQVDDFEGQVDDIAASLTTLMNDYTGSISNAITGSLAFVFPGAQTFLFSNPSFSNNLDLTVQVAYPSQD